MMRENRKDDHPNDDVKHEIPPPGGTVERRLENAGSTLSCL